MNLDALMIETFPLIISRSIMLGQVIFFLSMVAIAAATMGALPPKVVYSATIRNRLDSPIRCHVVWATPSEQLEAGKSFTIMDGERHHVPEKLVDMGTWEGAAVIDKIDCGKNLVLEAPFDGVSSPQRDWQFTITTQGIVSVGTSTRES